ncbi:MAG: hypothetical protein D6798_14985 [Deltaproteobacteria bacterium]|nr:MAG: hypothetical protein D6798_14985 [Deltaproteobacteria bacterium]
MLSTSLMSLSLVAAAAAGPDADADANSPLPPPRPTALVQVWGTVYDMDEQPQADPASYGDPEDDTGVKIRRARIGLEGDGDTVRYVVTVGASPAYDALSEDDTDIQLVDAALGFSPGHRLWIDAGVIKPPVGREALMSSSQLALAERAVLSEWLVPGREAGVSVDWSTTGAARFRLRGGAYNGNGGIFGDDNTGELLAARAEVAVGPARTYRTWGPNKGFTIGVGVDGYYDADISTTTASAGGDVMLRVAGLSILAEGRFARLQPVHTDVDVPGVFATTDRWGALGQVSYGLGPVEPAVRVSIFDDDTDSDDAGDVAAIDLGVTGHLLDDHARVGAGYVMRIERGGSRYSNDTIRLWSSLRY